MFENPYVDAAGAAAIAGNARFQAEADSAQRQSQVMLENRDGILPLDTRARKVWIYGIDASAAGRAGLTVVSDLRAADVAILRVATPFERLHPYYFFGQRQNEGRLDFRDGDADYEAIKKASALVPTVVFVDLDRAAVLTNVRDKVRALVATFGASDAAVLDVAAGRAKARGRLPLELPSSMKAVGEQDSAVADDSAAPLYAVGAGLQEALNRSGARCLAGRGYADTHGAICSIHSRNADAGSDQRQR
ncbi:MAG: glycoside hydrolase family 3 C-terminal domain-containing protein [Gammaproteobacteria bacterium]